MMARMPLRSPASSSEMSKPSRLSISSWLSSRSVAPWPPVSHDDVSGAPLRSAPVTPESVSSPCSVSFSSAMGKPNQDFA